MKEFDVVNILEPRLKSTSYGQTYYELLGVNIYFSGEEITTNYKHIKKFMNEHRNYFNDNDIKKIDNAYNYLRSLLSLISYGNDIKKEGITNTTLQYAAKIKNEKMLKSLREELGKNVTVEYMEEIDGKFVITKLIGNLVEMNDYDNIIVANNFDISFLGDKSAIISVMNSKKEKVYYNEYLDDENKRELYSSNTKEDFRQVFWSYFISQQINVLEKEKLDKEEKKFVKKR